MVFPNPAFHYLPILFSLLNNKVCFSFGRYIGHVVIDLIPLPSAVLECMKRVGPPMARAQFPTPETPSDGAPSQ
jgi:hypothetical protein